MGSLGVSMKFGVTIGCILTIGIAFASAGQRHGQGAPPTFDHRVDRRAGFVRVLLRPVPRPRRQRRRPGRCSAEGGDRRISRHWQNATAARSPVPRSLRSSRARHGRRRHTARAICRSGVPSFVHSIHRIRERSCASRTSSRLSNRFRSSRTSCRRRAEQDVEHARIGP